MQPFSFTELVGLFTGHLAVFAVAKERAEAALALGMSLAPQAITPPSMHPMLVWFGRQEGVHLTRLRALPGFPLDYSEVILGVPFVHREEASGGPRLHLCQLFLDSAMAVIGGLSLWGFPKKMARMERDSRRFAARTAMTGARILECVTRPLGESAPLSSMRGAEEIGSLLAQPLIEATMAGFGPGKVGSTFTWDLDHAIASPARARLSLGEIFSPSIAGDHDVTPLDERGLGALQITSRWRLSLPYPT